MAATNLPKTKSGFNYKYTELAQINEYLEGIGVSYYQYIETVEGIDYMVTVPIIDGKEQPPRRGCKVIDSNPSNKSNPAQAQGSGITYARRYSLLMAFGLATEDDDAQALSGNAPAPARKEEKKDPDEAEYKKARAACIKALTDAGTSIEACARVYKVDSFDNMTIKQLENATKHAPEIAAKDKENQK